MIIENKNNFAIKIDDEVINSLKYFDFNYYIDYFKRAVDMDHLEDMLREEIGEMAELKVPITYYNIDKRYYAIEDARLDDIFENYLDDWDYEGIEDAEDREYKKKADALYLFYDEKISEEISDIIDNITILDDEYIEIDGDGVTFLIDIFTLNNIEYIPIDDFDVLERMKECESIREIESMLYADMYEMAEYYLPVFNHLIDKDFESLHISEIDEILEYLSEWHDLSEGIHSLKRAVLYENNYRLIHGEIINLIDNIKIKEVM